MCFVLSPHSPTLQKEKAQTTPPMSIQLLGFSARKTTGFPSLHANSRMQRNQMDYDGVRLTGRIMPATERTQNHQLNKGTQNKVDKLLF